MSLTDMHELAIAMHLMDELNHQATSNGLVKIQEVHLEVGLKYLIEPPCMQTAYEAVTEGTLAEGSKLILIHPEEEVTCVDCGTVYGVQSLMQSCPNCGSSCPPDLGSMELMLIRLIGE